MTTSDRSGSRPLALDLGVTRRLVEWREKLEARPTSPERDRDLGNVDRALADDVPLLLAELGRLRDLLDAERVASGGWTEECASTHPAAFARAALRGDGSEG